jgi:hypothetical protein
LEIPVARAQIEHAFHPAWAVAFRQSEPGWIQAELHFGKLELLTRGIREHQRGEFISIPDSPKRESAVAADILLIAGAHRHGRTHFPVVTHHQIKDKVQCSRIQLHEFGKDSLGLLQSLRIVREFPPNGGIEYGFAATLKRRMQRARTPDKLQDRQSTRQLVPETRTLA